MTWQIWALIDQQSRCVFVCLTTELMQGHQMAQLMSASAKAGFKLKLILLAAV